MNESDIENETNRWGSGSRLLLFTVTRSSVLSYLLELLKDRITDNAKATVHHCLNRILQISEMRACGQELHILI